MTFAHILSRCLAPATGGVCGGKLVLKREQETTTFEGSPVFIGFLRCQECGAEHQDLRRPGERREDTR